jgi:hypothetical protein
VRTKGEKRLARWLIDFRRWLESKAGHGDQEEDNDDQRYHFGVLLALSVSVGTTKRLTDNDLLRYSQQTIKGYNHGLTLMYKVAQLGDAPEGDFQDLLGAPHGEPLG